ncbi:ribosomal protein L1 [Candidatus Methanoperedens nitroreducens]|uniref:Large ribosomal subunit protein uL1 n=1 Tax=Candidatus Methanoperedens nitratireducens TaxID=1392998 RepID=A0A062V3I8_9EURY|nr:ribosomal protein L1 [Candidatus Methanoperedens nitroreducens]
MEHDKILDAVKQALEKSPQRKFSESIDLAINLKNLDMNQPQNRMDEEIILPNGPGKTIKIAVFAKGETAQRAKGAGADYVFDPDEISVLGEDKSRAKSLADEVNFFIAEAALMPAIGKTLGQVLGPRGKMPIPLTPDKDVVQLINRSRNAIKVRSKDKMTFHIPVGRKDMDPVKISENIEAIVNRIEHRYERGLYNVRSVYVKTTMGPSVKVI